MAADWFDGNGDGGKCDPVTMLEHCAEPLHLIVAAGALLSIGLTSDGGAMGVTVTVDGRWRREYFREAERLEVWLAEALPAVTSARGVDLPPAGNGRASRRTRARS